LIHHCIDKHIIDPVVLTLVQYIVKITDMVIRCQISWIVRCFVCSHITEFREYFIQRGRCGSIVSSSAQSSARRYVRQTTIECFEVCLLCLLHCIQY